MQCYFCGRIGDEEHFVNACLQYQDSESTDTVNVCKWCIFQKAEIAMSKILACRPEVIMEGDLR